MVQPSDDKSQLRKRAARPDRPGPQAPARPQEPSFVDRAAQRSDWEGMAPKPEQPSDDVAAPGQLPGRAEDEPDA